MTVSFLRLLRFRLHAARQCIVGARLCERVDEPLLDGGARSPNAPNTSGRCVEGARACMSFRKRLLTRGRLARYSSCERLGAVAAG